MIRKGFVIDTQNYEVAKYVEYNDKIVEDFYVKDVNASSKEGANLLFAAMTFPIECEEEVREALSELKIAKKSYESTVERIFYKRFREIKDKAKL